MGTDFLFDPEKTMDKFRSREFILPAKNKSFRLDRQSCGGVSLRIRE